MNSDLKLKKLREDIVNTLEKRGNAAAKGHAGLNNLSKQLLALAEEGRKVEREQQILESLSFKGMQQQEETIKDAHKSSLDWMFEKNEIKFMD
jgi:hypothetical protein